MPIITPAAGSTYQLTDFLGSLAIIAESGVITGNTATGYTATGTDADGLAITVTVTGTDLIYDTSGANPLVTAGIIDTVSFAETVSGDQLGAITDFNFDLDEILWAFEDELNGEDNAIEWFLNDFFDWQFFGNDTAQTAWWDTEFGDGDAQFWPQGDDIFNFGAGDDKAIGGEGDDTLNGGAGDDELRGFSGDDTIRGGDDNDTLRGDAGKDDIRGDDGDDDIRGDAGDDDLRGGAGEDTIRGGNGEDKITGGDDNDRLMGGKHADKIFGEAGEDVIIGEQGKDTLDGGDDDDFVYGGEGNDKLKGGNGDDTLVGWTGNDNINGNGGTDWVQYETAKNVTVDLSKTKAQNTGQGKDKITNVENIDSRGSGDDNLTGNDGDNRIRSEAGEDMLDGGKGNDNLQSGDGDDAIKGGKGNDFLDGEGDNDTLTGNSGSDTFAFQTGGGDDTITDFALNSDIIWLGGNTSATQFSDLTIVDDGLGNAVVTIDDISITVNNTTAAQLDQFQFDFTV